MNLAFPATYGITPAIDITVIPVNSADRLGFDGVDFHWPVFFRFISPTSSAIESFRCMTGRRETNGVPVSSWFLLYTANVTGGVGTFVTSSFVSVLSAVATGSAEELLIEFPVTAAITQGSIGYLYFYTTAESGAGIDVGIHLEARFNTPNRSYCIADIQSEWMWGRSNEESTEGGAVHGNHSYQPAAGLLTFTDGSYLGSPWKTTSVYQYQRESGAPPWNEGDYRSGIWHYQHPGDGRIDWIKTAGGQFVLPQYAYLSAATIKMFVPRTRPNGEKMPIRALQAHLFYEQTYLQSSPEVLLSPLQDIQLVTDYTPTREPNNTWVYFKFDRQLIHRNRPYQIMIQAHFVSGSTGGTHPWENDFQHDDPNINPHYYWNTAYDRYPADKYSSETFLWRSDQYPGVSYFPTWNSTVAETMRNITMPFVKGDLDTSGATPVITNWVVDTETDTGLSLSLEWSNG